MVPEQYRLGPVGLVHRRLDQDRPAPRAEIDTGIAGALADRVHRQRQRCVKLAERRDGQGAGRGGGLSRIDAHLCGRRAAGGNGDQPAGVAGRQGRRHNRGVGHAQRRQNERAGIGHAPPMAVRRRHRAAIHQRVGQRQEDRIAGSGFGQSGQHQPCRRMEAVADLAQRDKLAPIGGFEQVDQFAPQRARLAHPVGEQQGVGQCRCGIRIAEERIVAHGLRRQDIDHAEPRQRAGPGVFDVEVVVGQRCRRHQQTTHQVMHGR